ncbi:lanthionine synthetase LanC family protein [Schnuerera sp.]|uniref:lanthionine synthetase LanC family protein n=1 Tax=Schnuerera sp. TaxID=2794844 RepID=UPI002BCEE55B|nr:lanthionine synthetase LanC family protein [Schnuerera sp.]HSH35833.1 lanthionine synthetase LanC family protein [Schnuerera sp.]
MKKDMIIEKIDTVNEILMQTAPAMNNIGLLNGKTGVSIYFFHIAEITGNKKYQKLAKRLISEVYEEVNRSDLEVSFEDGLAGIAWGIEYLAKNKFMEAATKAIFSEIDNKIYRHIESNDELPIGILQGSMGFLVYVLSRLHNQGIQEEQRFIFRRLLIRLVNHIGRMVEERKYNAQEPWVFDISWDLPLCLILLGKAKKIDIYNYKIDRILDDISPIILSLFPRLSSNRLYLLLGMESILQQTDMPNWRDHATILKQNIAMTEILERELRDKSIHLMHGAAGVDLISQYLFYLIHEEQILFNREQLIVKIIRSEYWEKVEQGGLERRSVGLLFYGFTGVGLHFLELTK